jgi:hypothetical protein
MSFGDLFSAPFSGKSGRKQKRETEYSPAAVPGAWGIVDLSKNRAGVLEALRREPITGEKGKTP